MSSFCFSEDDNNKEQHANAVAQRVVNHLSKSGVSEQRIGYLTIGRYPTPNDTCPVTILFKRLKTFEGFGNRIQASKETVRKTQSLSLVFLPNQAARQSNRKNLD